MMSHLSQDELDILLKYQIKSTDPKAKEFILTVRIQRMLCALGYALEVDGIYGQNTHVQFERAFRLMRNYL